MHGPQIKPCMPPNKTMHTPQIKPCMPPPNKTTHTPPVNRITDACLRLRVVITPKTRMYSSRMRTVRCSGCLSCHAFPHLPCMTPDKHDPCHERPLPCTHPATHPPTTEGMIHACENITFPQLLLRTVIKQSTSYLVEHVSILHEFVQQEDHYVGFAGRHRPGCRSQLRTLAEEAHHHCRVPAANSPVQRPHPVVIHVLNGRAPVHQVLNLKHRNMTS